MLHDRKDLKKYRMSAAGRISAFLLAVLCVLLSLFGCGVNTRSGNEVQVVYLNADKNGLLRQKVDLDADTDVGKVAELLDLLEKAPSDSTRPVISGFTVNDATIDENTLILDCSSEYRQLDEITEKLTRAALVNTLCEIPKIRRVTLRVNGALLVDQKGGKSENMTADQFIYNTGREMLNFERAQMHLYFATEDGKKLVDTYRTVVFNGNIPMERLVVEQIIAGPNGDFNYPTVSPETKLVNIVTRDDICTVTLDRAFLAETWTVDPEVAVYSIVNSLTELPSIRQVQIIIEGVDNPVYMDTYILDFETLLQHNDKIVQGREEEQTGS